MTSTRMEAFSDAVIAVIITIMVLELKPPHHAASLVALQPLLPAFMSYVLSFIFIGIYWNNHHHLLQAIEKVNGRILWANLHLLFWLSLVPFFTAWMEESGFSIWPVAMYGIDLLLAGLAYQLLTHSLIRQHGQDSTLAKAYGYGLKQKLSLILYGLGIILAFFHPVFAISLYALVAVMWLIPDRRIEYCIEKSGH